MLNKKVLENQVNELTEAKAVILWNEYTQRANWTDDYIYTGSEFWDMYCDGCTVDDMQSIIDDIKSGFDPDAPYWHYDGLGSKESGSDPLDWVDMDAVIKYMSENETLLNCEWFLDEWEIEDAGREAEPEEIEKALKLAENKKGYRENDIINNLEYAAIIQEDETYKIIRFYYNDSHCDFEMNYKKFVG